MYLWIVYRAHRPAIAEVAFNWLMWLQQRSGTQSLGIDYIDMLSDIHYSTNMATDMTWSNFWWRKIGYELLQQSTTKRGIMMIMMRVYDSVSLSKLVSLPKTFWPTNEKTSRLEGANMVQMGVFKPWYSNIPFTIIITPSKLATYSEQSTIFGHTHIPFVGWIFH